jgi:hypothetical protein
VAWLLSGQRRAAGLQTRSVNAEGKPIGAIKTAAAPGPLQADDFDLAANPHGRGYLVIWLNADSSYDAMSVRGQHLTAGGDPVGHSFTVANTGTALPTDLQPTMVATPTGYLAWWYADFRLDSSEIPNTHQAPRNLPQIPLPSEPNRPWVIAPNATTESLMILAPDKLPLGPSQLYARSVAFPGP